MKNSLFQRTCIFLDKFIPKDLTKLIYYPSFLVFKALCNVHFGDNIYKVYLRNSFYLDYHTFGLSDYDFGIVLKTRTPKHIWNSFYTQFKLLKTIFPFWSEINVYIQNELNDIIPFINPIEAKRDPYLSTLIKTDSSVEERFTFINRCLFTNLKNWNFESLKTQKWNAYFGLCKLEIPNRYELDFILNHSLRSLFQTEIQNNYPHFIQEFHTLFLNSKDILWEKSSEEQKIIMPHYYLWFEREEGSEYFLKNLSSSDRLLLISQLKWEIWGLSTQMYLFQNNPGFSIHLNRIKKVFEILQLPKKEIHSIDSLLSAFNSIN